MNDAPTPDGDSDGEPPNLRFLRMLVTVLTATMIAGVLVIIALLVIRLNAAPQPVAIALPETLDLPEGTVPMAVTFGPGWVALVTERGEILILDAETGTERQRFLIAP